MSEEQGKVEECEICVEILKGCERAGDKQFCEVLIDKLKSGEIDGNKFDAELEKKFGLNLKKIFKV